MLFQIRHTTSYSYSEPVFCEPFTIRLRPREDSSQQLSQYQLNVTPEPVGMTQYLDLDGNSVAHCWFEGLTDELAIETTCFVETLRVNPFDFVVAPEAEVLPLQHAGPTGGLFDYYQRPESNAPFLKELADEILRSVDNKSLSFLCRLAERLYDQCETVTRFEGTTYSPEKTWELRQGACRDQAVLFNEVCRSVGLPARFVSGYSLGDDDQQEYHLHAWSEVYLPGAGWRGFDPTLGLAVGDRHVAVAVGRLPEDAAPTAGTFRGTNATSSIQSQVMLRACLDRSLPKQESPVDASMVLG